MTPTITLKPGTSFVCVRDIPSLIAEALHPEALDGQNQTITALMKIGGANKDPIEETNGKASDDPRPLMDEDWEFLKCVWASLPTYSDGLSENEWKPYALAWHETPNRPFQLIVLWAGSALLDEMRRIPIIKEHDDAIEEAVRTGTLIVRSQSRKPITDAIGEALMRCIVLVPDLAAYVERFGMTLEVSKIEARAKPDSVQIDPASEPWMVADPRDKALKYQYPWCIPARYFAREISRNSPGLTNEKIAKKVRLKLVSHVIKKRGNVDYPEEGTILKALIGLDFT